MSVESLDGPGGRSRPVVTLLAVCLVSILFPLSITGTSVALPDIGAQLQADLPSLQWAINGYNVAFAGLILAAGSFADVVGRRRVFVGGTALFFLGSIGAALAGDVVFLDVARVVAGVGAAAAAPAGSALLAQVFEGPARARAFGLFGTAVGLGLAFGPSVAGVLVSNAGWRAFFVVPAVIAGLTCLLYPLLPESRNPQSSVDKLGTVTFAGALVLLVLALVEAPQRGWTDALVLAAIVVSVVLFVAFVLAERRQQHPMFELALLAQRRFLGLCVTVVVVVFGFSPMVIYLPTYFTAVSHLDAQSAGVRLILLTAPTLVFPVIAGFLTRWIRADLQIIAIVALTAAGSGWLTVISPSAGATVLVGPMVLIGIAVGMAFGLLDGAAVSSVEASRAGMAAGMFNTMRLTGETIAIAVVGSMVTSLTVSGLAERLPAGARPGTAEAAADQLLQGGSEAAAQTLAPFAPGDTLLRGAEIAYTDALHAALWTICGLCVAALPLVAWLLRKGPDTTAEPGGAPDTTAEPATAAGGEAR